MNNIVEFPITNSQKKRNAIGKGFVPCEISGKYLDIKKNDYGEFLTIKVMTDQGVLGEIDYEICELVVSKSEILQAINQKG